ncbi:MAG: monovalent cation/H(+) antiporter subunit G [Maioricimonas sp. JB049]
MTDVMIAFFLATGTAFALLASIAVVRMPDLYTRMHGATKSATLGVGCMLLAVAIQFSSIETTTSAILVVAFLFLTAPVAAHIIGRAAHRQNVPKWSGTIIDEFPDGHPPAEHPDGTSS